LLVLPPSTSNVSLGVHAGAYAALLRTCERLQIARSQKELAWKTVVGFICPWQCSHRGTETGAACLSCPLKLQMQIRWFVPGAFCSATPKMRTSAESLHPEKASMESCCSGSSAHGTARTEAQKLGLLACLALSNFKRSLADPCRGPPTALLWKCERLQIDRRLKELAWKAVAQPHLPMALLAQRPSNWGCLLVLPPQTSNVS